MLAAVLLPAAATAAAGRRGSGGIIGAAPYVRAALCLVTGLAVASFASDPPRPPRAAAVPAPNPYRVPTLWRIHGASALLVVPQFVVTGFALEHLVNQRGWVILAAGRAIAAANLAGALTPLAAGRGPAASGAGCAPCGSSPP